MIYSSRGIWGRAEELFKEAITAANTVGDLRSFEESTIFLGTLQFLQGDVEESVKTTEIALKSAVLRGDIQTQLLALTEQTKNHYTLGDDDKCLKGLDEIQLALENVDGNDVAAEINYHGLKALVYMKTEAWMDCWQVAEEVFHTIENAEPTAYYTYFGYAALVEVYILLAQNTAVHAKIPRQRIQVKAEKTLIALAKFAKVFPIAMPRFYLWQGVSNWLNGKVSKAEKDWLKAIEYSENFGMKYEHAFILYQRGTFTKKKEDLAAAVTLFPQMSKSKEMSPQMQRQEIKLSKILGEKIKLHSVGPLNTIEELKASMPTNVPLATGSLRSSSTKRRMSNSVSALSDSEI